MPENNTKRDLDSLTGYAEAAVDLVDHLTAAGYLNNEILDIMELAKKETNLRKYISLYG